MKKLILGLAVTITTSSILHAQETEPDTKEIRLANPEQIDSIHFSFFIKHREHYDSDIWKEIVQMATALTQEVQNKEIEIAPALLSTVNRIYISAKNADCFDGNVSLYMPEKDEIRLSVEDQILEVNNLNPEQVVSIQLALTIERKDDYEHELWESAVKTTLTSCSQLLENNLTAFDDIVEAMKKIYSVINGSTWADAVVRTIYNQQADKQLNKRRLSFENDEEDGNDTSACPCEQCTYEPEEDKKGIEKV